MIPGFKHNAPFQLGMVVALPAEAKAMLGRRRWSRYSDVELCTSAGPAGGNTLWVRCGMGADRAAGAAAFMLEQGVTHLGIAGVSGGLDTDLSSGQLVLASEVIDEGGKRWPVDPWICRALTSSFGDKVHHGPILTTAAPLLNSAQKTLWFDRSNALAVDMESAAVASVAVAADRPFFAMRAICDEAARSVPAALYGMVDDLGRPRPAKLMKSLILEPSIIPAMVRMQGDFGRALRALRYGWQVCCRLNPVYFDEGEEHL